MNDLCTETIKTAKLVDNLPTEIITKIFNNLDLSSLLKSRLVCHKWKFVVENNIKIENLSVRAGDEEEYIVKKHYEIDFRPVDQDYIFLTKRNEFIQTKVMYKILKNLKRLNINFKNFENQLSNSIFTFLNWLNQFRQLEVLQILDIETNKPASLQLPNLKAFSIDYNRSQQILILDLPKLQKLKLLCSLNKFKILYPEMITFLSLDDYDENVSKFKNLQIFYCKGRIQYNLLLSILPCLVEFHVFSITKAQASEILTRKHRLRRLNFQLFYRGFKINSRMDLDDYSVVNSEDLIDLNQNSYIVAKNYSKSSEFLPWINEIHFNSFFHHFNSRLNWNLTKKLINLSKIIVTERITDVDLFIKFIKNFKNLQVLKLLNSYLPSSFYRQIPNLTPSLTTLKTDFPFKLNLKFIFQLKNLEKLSLWKQEVSFSLIQKFFKELKNFFKFKFLLNLKLTSVVSIDDDDDDYYEHYIKRNGVTFINGIGKIDGFSYDSRSELFDFLKGIYVWSS